MKKELIFIKNKPWLIPILLALLDYYPNYTSVAKLKERVNTRSVVIRRALWYLRKMKIVDVKVEGVLKYKLRDDWVNDIRRFLEKIWKKENKFVVEFSDSFILIRVRKKEITCKVISKRLLEKFMNVARGRRVFMPGEISLEMGVRVEVVNNILRILEILGKVKREGKYFKMES